MNLVINVILALASLVLVFSILMQSGKSAGMSGSIGGGAEQIFGKNEARGLDKVFDRATKFAAVAFIICAVAHYVF
ncbi:MAG: preprotein translocase subunit SecG [Alteromonadales bacterium]|nr:preprotein translocase subunit SecG [Alteromonadales bacterium]